MEGPTLDRPSASPRARSELDAEPVVGEPEGSELEPEPAIYAAPVPPRSAWERALPWLPVRLAVFFALFVSLGQAGYLFAYAPYTAIGVFWPAAGLSVGVLLLEDRRAWPAFLAAIFLGECVGGLSRGLPAQVPLSWATAATLEAFVAAELLRRTVGVPFELHRLRAVVAFTGVALVLAPALAASLAGFAAYRWLAAPSWAGSWAMWWLGDALGILVVAPLLVAWLGCSRGKVRVVDLSLGVLLVAGMALCSEALFGGRPDAAGFRFAPGFLTFPLLLWAAVRLGPRGVTLAAAILNVLAVYNTTHGEGLFSEIGETPVERLVTLQAYLSFVTLSSLALAAAVMERRAGERQLQDMIDNATAAVFAKRTDGRYLFVNREFERIAARPREEIVGHTPAELWPPAFADSIRGADAAVLRHRQARTRLEVVPVDGEPHTFLSVRFPLLGESGVPYAVGGMATDISDRTRAEQALRRSEERFKLIVAATRDAVYDWDVTTGRVWWNERYQEMFGRPPSRSDIGWEARLHADDREEVLASLKAAQAAGARRWTHQYRLLRADGSYAHVQSNAYLLYDRDDRLIRMVGALTDVTERHAAQEELRRINVELEQRVERRTAQLAAAYHEMESFSYSISHDLRGPLRAINGFAKVLEEDHGPALPLGAHAYLGRIRGASQRMSQLIDDLLLLSRAGRAEVRHVEVDISEMATSILRDLREAEPAREVTTVIEPGLAACGDPGLLRVVLQNLLANAWKFTSRKDRARIEVGRAREGADLAFYVKDDGAGFDERYAARLFRPFERLHGTSEFPGTGIGLATIHRIVGRHGGRVWATGTVDVGATFYFTLPPRDC